jgi:hypothetical protein
VGAQIPETGGRIFWTGTNATIPGIGVTWQEDTAFAERFFQGDTTTYAGPANGGGTHTHTSVSHPHTGNEHTHGVLGGDASVSEISADGTGGATCSDGAHGHPGGVSAGATITYGAPSVGVTWPASTDDPPHVKVLVIEIVAAAGDQDIPDDGVVFGLTTPAGFAKVAALDGKFLQATTSGGDSDLGGAGSATHTHTSVAGHSHAPADHTHPSNPADGSDLTRDVTPGTPGLTLLEDHHNVSLQSQTTTLSTDSITSDATSSEPSHIELLPVQNTSGGAVAPVDDSTIIPYVGTYAQLAALSGWELYAPADSLQVKCTTTDGNVGNTGGSNSHTHSSSHGHTHSGAHTHTPTVSQVGNQQVDAGAVGVIERTKTPHFHGWSIFSTTPTLQNASVPLTSQDGRPPYRTVLWARKVAATKRVTLGTIHGTSKEVLAG